MIATRKLVPEDVVIFRSIRLEGLARHPENFGAALEEEARLTMSDFAARIENNAVFGAFKRGQLVGVAGLRRSPLLRQNHKAYLWGMYVRPAARGSGAGASLLEDAIEQARGDVSLIQLNVATSNDGARRLYERYGFEQYGIEVDACRIDGRSIDDILMVKRLDEG